MNEVAPEIHAMMKQLLADMGSDFCALGLLEKDNRLRWKWAEGNISERFMDMEDRPGRGFQQSVIKVGRAMTLHVTDLIASRTLHEYPLLPSEKLRSVHAVPLYEDMNVIGILVVGDRSKRIYNPEDRKCAAMAAEQIALILKGASDNVHAPPENMLN